MNKPLKEMIFRKVEGTFRNVAGDSATLAEVLTALEIIVDDKCEFARFNDYEKNLQIWYRVENAKKIRITLWQNTQC